MAKYGVTMNGELLEDEIYDTREEAEDAAAYCSSCEREGQETLEQFQYDYGSDWQGSDYDVVLLD